MVTPALPCSKIPGLTAFCQDSRPDPFTEMLKHYEAHSPLKRNVLPEELGATGTFLASDGAAAITGQVIYVDCGYQIMGM